MSDIIVEPSQPWLLTPTEANAVRSRQKFWVVKLEKGSRTVVCRECGEPVPSGELRISFKHLNLVARFYDKKGYCHTDRSVCSQNLVVNSCIAQQCAEAEKILLEHPEIVNEEKQQG
jgi:hypothetical protein